MTTGIDLELTAQNPPYDGQRLLWFLGLHAVPGLESWDGTSYARVLRLPGGPGAVRLQATPAGYVGELRLPDPAAEAMARRQLAHLLDLDGDLRPGIEQLRRDDVIGRSITERPGLRWPGSVDHVETLLRTVVGQQVSLGAARSVTGTIVSRHGRALPRALMAWGLTHAFPTVRTLSVLDAGSLPMPRARGRSVIAAAQAIASGGEDLVDGTSSRRTDLLALPGIGPWTASYLAFRVARDADVFLPSDLAVRRALERRGLPGDRAAAAAVAQRWAPFRSLALIQLWTGLLEGRESSASASRSPASASTLSVAPGTLT